MDAEPPATPSTHASGQPSVSLCELGPVGVRLDGRFVALNGLRSCLVMSLLSIEGAGGVRTDAMVDMVWGTTSQPRTARMSLANIVSRFRTRYGHEFIESNRNGYRLGTGVVSERSSFIGSIDDATASMDVDPAGALNRLDSALSSWRGQPWAELDSHWLLADRTYLESMHTRGQETRARVLTTLGRSSEAVAVLERLVGQDPLNESTWTDLANALRTASRRAEALRVVARARVALAAHGLTPGPLLLEVERAVHDGSDRPIGSNGDSIRMATDGVRSSAAPQLEVLHTCGSRWLRGDTDGAVDALMAAVDEFEADVARRLRRCLTGIPSGEPIARQLWAFMMQEWTSLPAGARRSLISNDARALELAGAAGLVTADAEVELAETQAELVRALRVRFMVGLGYPLEERQFETVRRLAGIETVDAAVESARFEAIVKIKQGRMDQAVECLHRYASVVAEAWPMSGDDFASMALHILAMHPDRELLGIPMPSGPSYPVFVADAMAARVAQAWHHSPRSAGDQSFPHGFLQVLDTTTSHCAAALQLRWNLRTNKLDEAAMYATDLRDRLDLMPRDRWFHAVPAALGEYAISTKDRQLAATVAEVMNPWSGEIVGLWPMDVIIGPADRLLEHVASVQ